MKELEGRGKPAVDRVVGATGAVGVGVAATLLLGPVLGPLVGAMSGPMLEEVSNGLRSIIERRATRVNLAIDTATAEGQVDTSELVQRALMDDRRVELLTTALEAAATSDSRRKILALGSALAKGVLTADDEQLNEYFKIVTTLAVLDQIDVQVLEQISKAGGVIKRPNSERKITALTEVVPEAAPIVDTVVARLSNLGLITDEAHGLTIGSSWYVTEFGQLCLEALRVVGGGDK